MMKRSFSLLNKVLVFLLFSTGAFAQSIADKKASMCKKGGDLDSCLQMELCQVNDLLCQKRKEVLSCYHEAEKLQARKEGGDREYRDILKKLKEAKQQIEEIKENWLEAATKEEEDPYALWHQPDATLEQLVIDYGSHDFVYLLTPEVGSIKISVSSNIPIPRATWNEMLEVILLQNGVGVRKINSFIKQLYLLKKDSSGVQFLTNNRKELEVLPDFARVGFLLTPEPACVRKAGTFLEKFINPDTTTLHFLGRDILIVGGAQDVTSLLKLYDFVGNEPDDRQYRLFTLSRVQAEEMQGILTALFCDVADEKAGYKGSSLQVIPLNKKGNALFLIGSCEELRRAELVIKEVDCYTGDVKEKVVHWYTCKHSDPEELATVLAKIYNLILCGTNCDSIEEKNRMECAIDEALLAEPQGRFQDSENCFFRNSGCSVNPPPVQMSKLKQPKVNVCRDNFIVDLKTGSIVMVVEARSLDQIQNLIRKLDVPKKMVQIEVLLFEKRVNNTNKYGLNLLKIGSEASGKQASSLVWNDTLNPMKRGILEFIFSRPKTDFAPFDLTYNFLLTRDDIQVNASPSITTVNQTPASISIVDEISINTGVFDVDTYGRPGKDSFERKQYGINLKITPTIHEQNPNDPDPQDYITLETNIIFDTIQTTLQFNNRPDVTRRNIINEVRIPDGQTVILGGLRKKNVQDAKESIPFIGEIPGIGKLFSTTNMTDTATEMFIFITPRIIRDPGDDMKNLREEQLQKRPGDIPGFLYCLEESRLSEKHKLLQGTMQILFGRKNERYFWPMRDLDECEEPTY